MIFFLLIPCHLACQTCLKSLSSPTNSTELITEQFHIVDFHHVGLVDVFLLTGVEDGAVIDTYVMNHLQGAFYGDANAGIATDNTTDVDVAKLRDKLRWRLTMQ